MGYPRVENAELVWSWVDVAVNRLVFGEGKRGKRKREWNVGGLQRVLW